MKTKGLGNWRNKTAASKSPQGDEVIDQKHVPATQYHTIRKLHAQEIKRCQQRNVSDLKRPRRAAACSLKRIFQSDEKVLRKAPIFHRIPNKHSTPPRTHFGTFAANHKKTARNGENNDSKKNVGRFYPPDISSYLPNKLFSTAPTKEPHATSETYFAGDVLGFVIISKSSERNGVTGNPCSLNKLHTGLSAQA
jgi:hypothetical protein